MGDALDRARRMQYHIRRLERNKKFLLVWFHPRDFEICQRLVGKTEDSAAMVSANALRLYEAIQQKLDKRIRIVMVHTDGSKMDCALPPVRRPIPALPPFDDVCHVGWDWRSDSQKRFQTLVEQGSTSAEGLILRSWLTYEDLIEKHEAGVTFFLCHPGSEDLEPYEIF